MKTSQLLIILTLLALLVATNQLFTEASSFRRYLGGLPWYGWAGISLFLVLAGVLFALRDAKRANRLLEEPIEKHMNENVKKLRLSTELLEQYDPDGPAYPHPVVIADRCIGCQACVDACPHNVLVMIHNVAVPTARDVCAEDTACEVACPVNPKACIVVNTTKDIKPRPVPERNDRFMTKDVPGCYLIGDVSGTPLIKNAANEGAAVINDIAKELEESPPEPKAEYAVAIIGIGPAGLSAAVQAQQLGLKYVGIERDKVLSTIVAYPKDKYLFFKPESMEARGAIPIEGDGIQCEQLLESWFSTMKNSGVVINEQEECTAIQRAKDGDYFTVETKKKGEPQTPTYRARRVVLSLGGRGAPKKLRAPGEDELKDKVLFILSKPEDFKQKNILVVGGGNSAVEASVNLVARREGNQIQFRPPEEINDVTLVVRSGFTNDIKFANKVLLYHCIDAGKVKLCWDTGIKEVRDNEVVLMDRDTEAVKETIPNDYIFALIGADPPIGFLKSIGITIPKH